MSDNKINDKTTDEKIHDLEVKLIRQEHRLIPLVRNYLFRNSKWPDKNDRRREASFKALLYELIFSPTVIVLGTSILGVLTIFFMFRQTELLETQNKLFEFQNLRIEQQTELAEGARRSSQVFIMGEVLSDVYNELKSKNNNEKKLSKALVGRIIGLSSSMKPYKYLENDRLIDRPLSPERAQLLRSLIESDINESFLIENILKKTDLKYCDLTYTELKELEFNNINLRGSSFDNANLDKVSFNKSVMYSSSFYNTRLFNVDFSYSKLYNTTFSKSYLINVDFTGANISQVNFKNTIMQGNLLFENAVVNRNDWIEYIKDSLNVSWGMKLDEMYKIGEKNTVITGSGDNLTEHNSYVLMKK